MKRRTPKEILNIYQRMKAKKAREGIDYSKSDFARDLGYKRAGTLSDILSGQKPIPQVEIILDYMERDLKN